MRREWDLINRCQWASLVLIPLMQLGCASVQATPRWSIADGTTKEEAYRVLSVEKKQDSGSLWTQSREINVDARLLAFLTSCGCQEAADVISQSSVGKKVADKGPSKDPENDILVGATLGLWAPWVPEAFGVYIGDAEMAAYYSNVPLMLGMSALGVVVGFYGWSEDRGKPMVLSPDEFECLIITYNSCLHEQIWATNSPSELKRVLDVHRSLAKRSVL